MVLLLFYFICLILKIKGSWDTNFTYSAWLDPSTKKFRIYWTIYGDNIDIGLEAEIIDGWFAIGISPNGKMPNSDIMYARIDNTQGAIIEDRFASVRATPTLDTLNGLTLQFGEKNSSHSRVWFTRALIPCDTDQDLPILKGTTRIIYAMGSGTFNKHSFKGSKSLKMYTGETFNVEMPNNVQTFDLIQPNITIPNIDTSYYCTFYELPVTTNKRHIIKFDPIIKQGNELFVHHIVAYGCVPNSFDVNKLGKHGHCNQIGGGSGASCSVQIMAWAVGATGFTFPQNVGLPMTSLTSNAARLQYIRLEMHYDNPNLIGGTIDNSGIRIYYTDTIRQYDASLFEVGLAIGTYQFIPQGVPDAVNTAICSTECMDASFETESKVFGVFLHAHTLGTAISLRHIRGSIELEPIAVDWKYDFDYQQIIPIDPDKNVTIKAGDKLILDCYYDSTFATGITWGGQSTSEEMCQAYIYMYPPPKGIRCESSWLQSQINKFGSKAIEYGYLTSGPYIWYDSICADDYYKSMWIGTDIEFNNRQQRCPLYNGNTLNIQISEPIFTEYQYPTLQCTGLGSGNYSNINGIQSKYDINSFDLNQCKHRGGNGIINPCSVDNNYGFELTDVKGASNIKIGIKIDCIKETVNISVSFPVNTWIGIVFGSSMVSSNGNPAMVYSTGKTGSNTETCAEYSLTETSESGVNAVTPNTYTLISKTVSNNIVTIECSQLLSDSTKFNINTETVQYGVAWGSGLRLQYHDNYVAPFTQNLYTGQTKESGTLLYKLHGVCMWLSWGIFAFIGIFVSANRYLFKTPGKWFMFHRKIFQPLCLLFFIIGFILIMVKKKNIGKPILGNLTDPHQGIGFFCILIGILQPINALCRGSHDEIKKRTTRRVIWEYIHKGLGYSALILAQVTIILGLLKLNQTLAIVQLIFVIILFTIFIIFVVKGRSKKGKVEFPNNTLDRATTHSTDDATEMGNYDGELR